MIFKFLFVVLFALSEFQPSTIILRHFSLTDPPIDMVGDKGREPTVPTEYRIPLIQFFNDKKH